MQKLTEPSPSDWTATDTAVRTLIEKGANSCALQIAEVYPLRNDAKATFEWLDPAWSKDASSDVRFT